MEVVRPCGPDCSNNHLSHQPSGDAEADSDHVVIQWRITAAVWSEHHFHQEDDEFDH